MKTLLNSHVKDLGTLSPWWVVFIKVHGSGYNAEEKAEEPKSHLRGEYFKVSNHSFNFQDLSTIASFCTYATSGNVTLSIFWLVLGLCSFILLFTIFVFLRHDLTLKCRLFVLPWLPTWWNYLPNAVTLKYSASCCGDPQS